MPPTPLPGVPQRLIHGEARETHQRPILREANGQIDETTTADYDDARELRRNTESAGLHSQTDTTYRLGTNKAPLRTPCEEGQETTASPR